MKTPTDTETIQPFVFELTSDIENTLYQQLEATGFACLESIICPEYLLKCQKHIDELIEIHGARYFSLIQPWKDDKSAFAPIASNRQFIKLLSNLCERSAGEECVKDFDIYNVLRVIAGPHKTNNKQSFKFHYDATVITALMPLCLPKGVPTNEAGHLIAIPNFRPLRHSVILNLLEKSFLQNSWTGRYLGKKLLRYPDERHIFRLKPGNLYFFWGYRTLHANLPVRSNSVRATMLFHFGDPHKNSLITKCVLAIRRFREQRNLSKVTK
jgi:hypothetical protein